jgi:hypothetical protein
LRRLGSGAVVLMSRNWGEKWGSLAFTDPLR